ncbi:DUF4149 domain-containing protein [Nitratireductor alexandrii]|uniref:DUF4149 domain-containing protein n=1 Tax=Nitratireductor alexandrii TaxID=2448161 RepID=UPI000FD8C5F1|nr:DUF4149 domain-containing protein [Nitratireductor alexandrii]
MAARVPARLPLALTALVAAVWLGMVVGVSFLATPVKFEAPSLDLPVALEVGRVTFGLFSRVEWGMAVLLAVAVGLPGIGRGLRLLAAFVLALVAVEAIWLLPALDARVEAVIQGQPEPASWHHLLYAVAETGKAVLLAALALSGLRRLGANASLDRPVDQVPGR